MIKIATFGERIKEIRTAKGISQQELADFLGTSKQVISRYETNQRTPKITVVNEYAEKLNIELNFLLGEENPTNISSLSPEKQEFIDFITTLDDRELQKVLDVFRAIYNLRSDTQD